MDASDRRLLVFNPDKRVQHLGLQPAIAMNVANYVRSQSVICWQDSHADTMQQMFRASSAMQPS